MPTMTVAQLAERRVVVPHVVGLSPICHPISRYQSGLMAQSAKLLIREFKSHPRVTAMELCELHVK